MLTRTGDLGQSQRLTATLLATRTRTRADEQAVASGKAATSYAAIPAGAGRLLRAEDARRLQSTFIEQNEQLSLRLRTTDQVLGGVIAVAERARGLLVQRLNGATGASVPLAAEAAAMLAEVAGQLNTTHAGEYLFAGSRSDSPPVTLPPTPITTADPALYYAGDGLRATARIDVGDELEHGLAASEPPFAELIAALGLAAQADGTQDRAGLEAALDQIGDALDGLVGLRAGLGVGAARLERVTETQRSTVLYLYETISGIEDTDLAEVMTRLAQDQASLEAAFLVTGRLAALSLADYLR